MKSIIIPIFLFISYFLCKIIRKNFYKLTRKTTIKEINHIDIRKLINEENKLDNIINIYYPEDKVDFISSITNNGNLFILTNNGKYFSPRIIYAIKSDGTNFFDDVDQPYKILNCTTKTNYSYPVFTFYNIKGREYLASYSQGEEFELIDLKKDIIYSAFHFKVINYIPNNKKDSFFSLNFYNNSQYIINTFVSRKENCLVIQKIPYDIMLKNKLNPTDPINLSLAYKASSVNCFEIKEYIECLYVNSDSFYTVIILNIESLELKYSQKIETNKVRTDYLFSKCIHLKDNIGAFIYFINNDSSPKLLFKELILPSNSESDFYLNDFFSSIIINAENKFNLDNNYYYNSIIKRDENNIFYISSGKEKENIIIVIIRFLNDYKSLMTLYYEIKIKELHNIKIYSDMTSFIFNGHLGIGITHYDYNKNISNIYSSYFIIGNSFSYDTIIQDDIVMLDADNMYEFKIENIKIYLENNIFRYTLKGIQILSEINEEAVGFNFYSNNNQKFLKLNDVLLYDDTISFKIVNSLNLKLGNYSIEYIPIISEANYEELDEIFDSTNFYSNDSDYNFSSFYQPEIFKLKKVSLFFPIHCYKTCEKCSYLGNKISHKCKECSSNFPYYTIDKISNNFLNCFESCPENFSSDEINHFLCKKNLIKNSDQCNESFPYEIIENHTCINDCHAIDFFNKMCKIGYQSTKAKEHIIENIRNEIINHSMDSVLINITNEKKIDLLIIEKKEIYQITSSFNQNNKEYNISTIKLGLCEDILKNKYNISQNNTLIILKMEYDLEGFYIPIIEYEIFHPDTKESLNLNYCQKEEININIPVLIDENELFKYNSSSDYFNDLCSSYTTKIGTDITLNDRKNEYNRNNMSLCEADCQLSEYNSNNKKVICKCNIKTKFHLISNIYLDPDLLLNKFTDFKSNTNIKVVKCYKKLFTIEGIISNIGSYILLCIITLYIIFSILFLVKGFDSLLYNFYKIINEYEKEKYKSKVVNTDELIKQNKKILHFQLKETKELKKMKLRNTIANKSSSKLEINSKINISDSNGNNKSSKNGGELKDIEIYKVRYKKEKTNINSYLLDIELNLLIYEKAIKYDKRTYCQYYYSLLKTKHILLRINTNDYNSKYIKICLLLFKFSLYFMVSSLFFNDSSMHKIYEDEGEFNFIYQFPKMIYSNIICTLINYFINFFSSSQKNILEIKKEKAIKLPINLFNKLNRCLKIKFILFYLFSFIFLFIFWYYISSFCSVFINTQIPLIKNTLISFAISLLFPLLIYLIPGIFRIISIKSDKKDKQFLYKISKIIQLF